MSKNLAQFTHRLDLAAKGISEAEVNGVNKVAFAMKTSVLGLMAEATGGDLRLSGVGRKGGAKIGASYKAASARINSHALLFATGPAHLVERDTRVHSVGTGGKRRKSDVIVMQLPNGDWATGPWFTGGSKGQKPFERGIEAVEPFVAQIMLAETRKGFTKAFGGR